MKLSENFMLHELTVTDTGFVNQPSKMEIVNLIALCKNVLQPVRDLYGKPITINSGYRCPLVNKKVGKTPTSQHTKGEAADITGGSRAENKILFELIRSNVEFDQLIDEKSYTWIHVSFRAGNNRKQILHL